MKPSNYNYYQPYDGGVIFMNGITEASFWVDSSKAEIYATIIENPNEYYAGFTSFIDRLKAQGFIVENDIDESSIVREKFEVLRNNNEYHIMILPTYACNLRCWYCVQEHKNEWLNDHQYDAIFELIQNRINNNKINSFRISWFGGEPLLAYDKVYNFTKKLKHYTSYNDIDFRCGITTNGTLLTPTRIEELKEAGVTHYQITIDGDKATHDSIKCLHNDSAYDTTMRNIALIANHTFCILRFNYSPKNLNPEAIIQDIVNTIPTNVRHNILFNLQPVWQEKFSEDDFEKVICLMNLAKEAGISACHKTGGLCYVDNANYDCIYPSGQVGKCENGIKNIKNAYLKPDGKIDASEADTFHYIPTHITTKSECSDCKYLPICWGPCAKDRYLQLTQFGRIFCNKGKNYESLHELIRNKYLSDIHRVTDN